MAHSGHAHDHHDCAHTQRGPARALAVAVGNTNTSFRALTEEYIDSPCDDIPTPDLHRRPGVVWKWLEHTAQANADTAVLLGGVVPQALDAFERHLRARTKLKVMRFRKQLPCPISIKPKPAKNVGDDRLLAALDALCFLGHHPWVIVDSGTALTVNSVRALKGARVGSFEGGLIMPGEALAFKALAQGTAQLPDLSAKRYGTRDKLPLVGENTADAIRAGVRWQQIHAALELAKAQAERLGKGARVLLTGGGLASLYPYALTALKRYKPEVSSEAVPNGLLAAWIIWNERRKA